MNMAGEHAEVFAWEVKVSAHSAGEKSCENVVIQVNGVEYPAQADGDKYSTVIPLESGENLVTAVCRTGNRAGAASEAVIYTARLENKPKAQIQVSLDGNTLTLDGSLSQASEKDGVALQTYVWSQARQSVEAKRLPDLFSGTVSGQTAQVALPAVDGEYSFALQITDAKGRQDTAKTYVVVENGTPRIPDYERENHAWVENAVIYGVIPRNFGSDGFKSITEKLDYLKDLGVTALWLAPVNLSPVGDYGYAVTDYFDLNPKYGSKEDFRTMVEAAHARGIRVLMDFVPNHSSVKHPYFEDTLRHGMDSHYWDFYDRDETGAFTRYFDWSHLPNLNFENPEVRRWMTEAFAYWVREFDVDGFRVDVAWGIRERRPDYWPEWRRELKRIKPDLLLLAEASARDEYYFDNGYDAAYDWTDQLGHWAWELVFEDRNLITYNLHTALTNNRQGFHPDALIFRFLNNNDTGTRFITNHGPDLTRVATALLLTLPGIPCIYTGDEVGEAFRPYSDPQPLVWKEQWPGLRDYHKKLVALRKEIPSLHSRLWETLKVEPHQQVYAYARYLAGYEQPVLVLLNFSKEPQQAVVELPEALVGLAALAELKDLLQDEVVPLSGSGSLTIAMPGSTARILAPNA